MPGHLLEFSECVKHDPVSGSGSHRYCLKAITVSSDPGRDKTAEAPTHGADAILVNPTLSNQEVDSRYDVVVIASSHVADYELMELLTVASTASVVRLYDQCAFGDPNFFWVGE